MGLFVQLGRILTVLQSMRWRNDFYRFLIIRVGVEMSKTKLPAIRFNNDFFTKPRNLKFIAEQGSEALTIILFLWTISSQEKKCKLKKDEVFFLNFPVNLSKEKIQQIITSAVEVGLLEEDEEYYFNSQIVSDFKAFEKKREVYKQNVEKRWNKGNTIVYAKDKDLKNKSNEPEPDTEYIYNNKNSEPPSEVDGRKQCKHGKYVYLGDEERELIKLDYARENLDESIIREAVFVLNEHIERHINSPNGEEYAKKGREKAFFLLTTGWVKEEIRKRQLTKTRLEQATKQKQKTETPPRPQPPPFKQKDYKRAEMTAEERNLLKQYFPVKEVLTNG